MKGLFLLNMLFWEKILCIQNRAKIRIFLGPSLVHPKSLKNCNLSVGSLSLILLVKPELPCMVLRTLSEPAKFSKKVS